MQQARHIHLVDIVFAMSFSKQIVLFSARARRRRGLETMGRADDLSSQSSGSPHAIEAMERRRIGIDDLHHLSVAGEPTQLPPVGAFQPIGVFDEEGLMEFGG